MSVIAHGEELLAAPAVVADGGVVDGEELQRLARRRPTSAAGSPRRACGSRRRRSVPVCALLFDPCHLRGPLTAERSLGSVHAAVAAAMHGGCPNRSRCRPTEMRRLGYAVVDRIVEHLDGLDDAPAAARGRSRCARAQPSAARRRTRRAIPTRSSRRCSSRCCRGVSAPTTAASSPAIGSPSTYVGALADAAAAGVNAFSGSWTGGSGPSTVELTVLDWLRDWCGMPAGTEPACSPRAARSRA